MLDPDPCRHSSIPNAPQRSHRAHPAAACQYIHVVCISDAPEHSPAARALLSSRGAPKHPLPQRSLIAARSGSLGFPSPPPAAHQVGDEVQMLRLRGRAQRRASCLSL